MKSLVGILRWDQVIVLVATRHYTHDVTAFHHKVFIMKFDDKSSIEIW